MAKNKWKDVLIEELITCHIYDMEHKSNPKKALQDIILWHIEVAEYFAHQRKWSTQLKNKAIYLFYSTPFPYWIYNLTGLFKRNSK